MSGSGGGLRRALGAAVLAALTAWGAYACWKLHSARQAAVALREAIDRALPADGPARRGARAELLSRAGRLAAGDYSAAPGTPTTAPAAYRAAAVRWLGRRADLRRRFVALAERAYAQQAEGKDVAAAREALAAAVAAAATGREAAVRAQLDLAERILAVPPRTFGAAGPAETLAGLLEGIEPAFRLGRDAMTEGHAAVEKLLARAAREAKAGRTGPAVELAALAAELAGTAPVAPAGKDLPAWFTALAAAPATRPAGAAAAKAMVELAEAMVALMPPAGPVARVVRRARRELEAGRADQAAWWAGVALNALGMTDRAVAEAASRPASAPADETP